jgi:hypothetical protein
MLSQLGLSARDRRVLFFGASTIGTLFAFARGVPALLEWQKDRSSEAAAESQQAAAARIGVRMLPALRDSLRDRQIRLAALDSVLLSGSSASAAVAELASMLENMADAASVKVTAMQLRADSAASGLLAQVAVRVNGVADVAGLAAFLRAIEGSETPLIVRELAVTQSEPAAPDGKVEALRVDVLVEGIARITGTTAEKRP